MTELLQTAAASRKVPNEAEHAVVTALLEQLSDSWYVIPSVAFNDSDLSGSQGRAEYEIDVVVAHRDLGFGIIETKGHSALEVQAGSFISRGIRLEPQPGSQLRRNAHGLGRLLASAIGRRQEVSIAGLLAFPNLAEMRGDLPPDLDQGQILFAADLDFDRFGVADIVEQVLGNRWQVALDEDEFASCIQAICPNANFIWDRQARARRARDRLRELCEQRTVALETLDKNRRLMITGGAGSGKTRLGVRWAQRALARDENVLMVSYNDPLGAELAERLGDRDGLVVGPFLRVVRDLPGLPALPEPPDAGEQWWNEQLPAHVAANIDRIEARFDTIIVDEAQDFAPPWTAVLDQLLAGQDSRFVLLADPQQDLFGRGFQIRSVEQGWVRCELMVNTRNTHAIAQLLRRRFSGVASGHRLPASDAIRSLQIRHLDDATEQVAAELARLDSDGVLGEHILVATFSSAVRDHLRAGLQLVPWEQRAEAIVCENVHRAKGTEYDHVLLVDVPDPGDANAVPNDRLLYVGISRAVFGLTVIAGADTLERLGIGSPT